MFGLFRNDKKTSSSVNSFPTPALPYGRDEPTALLSSHQPMIDRCGQALSMREPHWVTDVVTGLAKFFQSMPYTRDKHHTEVGGGFRFALECAFYAAQSAEGAIFTGRDSMLIRREAEPYWRFACFVAGGLLPMCSISKDRVVTDAQGRTWKPVVDTLHAWLKENQSDGMDIKWLTATDPIADIPSRAINAYLITHIMPKTIISQMNDVDERIVNQLIGCTSFGLKSPMNSLVESVFDKVRRQDQSKMLATSIKADMSRFDVVMLDALRSMVEEKIFSQDELPFCSTKDGMFISWELFSDVFLDKVSLFSSHFPRSRQSLFEIGLETGLFIAPIDKKGWGQVMLPKGHFWLKMTKPSAIFPHFVASQLSPLEVPHAEAISSDTIDLPSNSIHTEPSPTLAPSVEPVLAANAQELEPSNGLVETSSNSAHATPQALEEPPKVLKATVEDLLEEAEPRTKNILRFVLKNIRASSKGLLVHHDQLYAKPSVFTIDGLDTSLILFTLTTAKVLKMGENGAAAKVKAPTSDTKGDFLVFESLWSNQLIAELFQEGREL